MHFKYIRHVFKNPGIFLEKNQSSGFNWVYCGFFWMSTARCHRINIEQKNFKERCNVSRSMVVNAEVMHIAHYQHAAPFAELIDCYKYVNQSINQSISVCLCSRATSRLIVCKRNVQMIMSGYDFLKSQVLSCWRKVESVCNVTCY